MKKLLMLAIVMAVIGTAAISMATSFEWVGGHSYDATTLGNREFSFSLPGVEGEYGLIEMDK